MPNNSLGRLRELALFGALSEAALEFLLAEATKKEVKAGEMFFHQGDLGEAMYMLMTGSVEIIRETASGHLRLAQLSPGDCFGEMALIECAPRNANVNAITDACGLEISFARFHELYTVEPEQFLIVHMNMAREVCRRLRVAADLLSQTQAQLETLSAYGLYM